MTYWRTYRRLWQTRSGLMIAGHAVALSLLIFVLAATTIAARSRLRVLDVRMVASGVTYVRCSRHPTEAELLKLIEDHMDDDTWFGLRAAARDERSPHLFFIFSRSCVGKMPSGLEPVRGHCGMINMARWRRGEPIRPKCYVSVREDHYNPARPAR